MRAHHVCDAGGRRGADRAMWQHTAAPGAISTGCAFRTRAQRAPDPCLASHCAPALGCYVHVRAPSHCAACCTQHLRRRPAPPRNTRFCLASDRMVCCWGQAQLRWFFATTQYAGLCVRAVPVDSLKRAALRSGPKCATRWQLPQPAARRRGIAERHGTRLF